MDIIADHRHVRYEFLVIAMPAYASFLFVALIVVTVFDFQKRNILIYSIAFLLATLGYQLPYSASALMSSLLSSAGGESTRGPYGYDVLVASYVTYLLPVAGMYVAYFWTRLSLPQHGRSILFFLLLVGIHGQFIGVLEIVTSRGAVLHRILYYGSYWWELLVAACTIVFFVENREVVQRSKISDQNTG